MSDAPIAHRVLPDGRVLEAWQYLFNVRVTLAEPRDAAIGYSDCWCYATAPLAVAVVETWDGEGEPDGWIKHPASGRYRKNGDPAREEVNR